MSLIDDVRNQVDRVTRAGNGFKTRCPAHDDHDPSLFFGERADGSVWLECKAGCTPDSVWQALGLQPKSTKRKATFEEMRSWPIKATYLYLDEKGEAAFRKVRKEQDGEKTFFIQSPDGKGGWIDKHLNKNVGLFHLPKVIAGVENRETIFLVEGEKDVLTVESLGLIATTSHAGAGTWWNIHTEPLKGATIVILPDNDVAGMNHAEKAAKQLGLKGCSVKVVRLPGLKEKQDVSDWVADGGTKEQLLALVDREPEWDPSRSETPKSNATAKKREESQASQLVTIVKNSGAELFHDPDDEPYIRVPNENRWSTHAIKSEAFRSWISHRFYVGSGLVPGGDALRDACNTLGGIARFDGPEHPVHTRIAGNDSCIYIDLGSETWKAVQIDAEDWRVIDRPPVYFRRPRGMMAIPEPCRNGYLDDLRDFVNCTDEGWVLIAAWLVAALRARGPYPVLVLFGEQGSAKSVTARILGRCIDPNKAQLRRFPKNFEDLAIAAKNSWVLNFDNLSKISDDYSDALCSLATGSGFATRRHHTNDEEMIFDSQRPLILNGINETAERADLLDRALTVELPIIAESKRRTENELFEEFEKALPGILGGLYSAASVALRNLPSTKLSHAPRMADFATLSVAAEVGIGLTAGTFLKVYNRNRREANNAALGASPVGLAVLDLATHRSEAGYEPWEGTQTELLAVLNDRMSGPKPKDWPDTAQSLGTEVRRALPVLRREGVVFVDLKKSKAGKRFRIEIETGDGSGDDLSVDSLKPSPSRHLFYGCSDDSDDSDGFSGNYQGADSDDSDGPDCSSHGNQKKEGIEQPAPRESGVTLAVPEKPSLPSLPSKAIREQLWDWAASNEFTELRVMGGLPFGPGEAKWEQDLRQRAAPLLQHGVKAIEALQSVAGAERQSTAELN